MKLGLLAKILIISVSITLAGMVAVFWSSSRLFEDAYAEALQSRSHAIAQGLRIQLERVLSLGIRIDDLGGFDKQCKEAVERYAGVDFSAVVAPDGTILFHSDPAQHGRNIGDPALVKRMAAGTVYTVASGINGWNGYVAMAPVSAADGESVGNIQVGVSGTLVRDKLRSMQFNRIAVGAVALLAGFAVFIGALSFFVVRPLRRLTRSIEQIRADAGNLGRRVDLRTRDELGALTEAFNALLQTVQDTTVSKSSLEEAYSALKASEQKYRELLAHANVIILRLATDGTVTYFNEYAERFFGFRSDEILGRHLVGTIVPAVESATARDLGRMIDGLLADPDSFSENENENLTRDGRRVVIQWANRVILDADNKPSGVLCIGHDVTEKRQADRELDQHRHHLEELVFSRTAELAAARDAAEAANRAKSVFLANMSHELRTPMNAIMGMASLALRRATEPRQIDYLNKAIKASQHLLSLISDILDISRIEADCMELEEREFSVSEIIDDVVRMQDEAARAKGLDLSTVTDASVPPVLHGDPVRLRQILINFVGNAIKFSERGRIQMHVGIVDRDSESVLLKLEVADQGIGLSADQQARLFKPFSQVDDSLTRKYGGSGLGLVISRRIAELMGGEVGVSSEEGRGSRFWATVRLRLAREQELASDEAITSDARVTLSKDYRGVRILVAEDEPSNREVMKFLLLDAGLIPDLAVDGKDAVALAENGRHALVLMDLQMPVMNGLDACRAIRQLPGMSNIPIIATTANAFESDRDRCLSAGMNDHLAKPVVPARLYECLLRWLRRESVAELDGV